MNSLAAEGGLPQQAPSSATLSRGGLAKEGGVLGEEGSSPLASCYEESRPSLSRSRLNSSVLSSALSSQLLSLEGVAEGRGRLAVAFFRFRDCKYARGALMALVVLETWALSLEVTASVPEWLVWASQGMLLLATATSLISGCVAFGAFTTRSAYLRSKVGFLDALSFLSLLADVAFRAAVAFGHASYSPEVLLAFAWLRFLRACSPLRIGRLFRKTGEALRAVSRDLLAVVVFAIVLCCLVLVVLMSFYAFSPWYRCYASVDFPEEVLLEESCHADSFVWDLDESRVEFCSPQRPCGEATECRNIFTWSIENASRCSSQQIQALQDKGWEELFNNPSGLYGVSGVHGLSPSLVTLLQCFTLEGWALTMSNMADGDQLSQGWVAYLVFPTLVVLGGMTLTSLFTAILREYTDNSRYQDLPRPPELRDGEWRVYKLLGMDWIRYLRRQLDLQQSVLDSLPPPEETLERKHTTSAGLLGAANKVFRRCIYTLETSSDVCALHILPALRGLGAFCRQTSRRVLRSPLAAPLLLFVVILDGAALCAEGETGYSPVFSGIRVACGTVFVCEALLLLMALGLRSSLRDGFVLLDLMVGLHATAELIALCAVCGGVVMCEAAMEVSGVPGFLLGSLCALRALRLAKLFKHFTVLRMVSSLLVSLQLDVTKHASLLLLVGGMCMQLGLFLFFDPEYLTVHAEGKDIHVTSYMNFSHAIPAFFLSLALQTGEGWDVFFKEFALAYNTRKATSNYKRPAASQLVMGSSSRVTLINTFLYIALLISNLLVFNFYGAMLIGHFLEVQQKLYSKKLVDLVLLCRQAGIEMPPDDALQGDNVEMLFFTGDLTKDTQQDKLLQLIHRDMERRKTLQEAVEQAPSVDVACSQMARALTAGVLCAVDFGKETAFRLLRAIAPADPQSPFLVLACADFIIREKTPRSAAKAAAAALDGRPISHSAENKPPSLQENRNSTGTLERASTSQTGGASSSFVREAKAPFRQAPGEGAASARDVERWRGRAAMFAKRSLAAVHCRFKKCGISGAEWIRFAFHVTSLVQIIAQSIDKSNEAMHEVFAWTEVAVTLLGALELLIRLGLSLCRPSPGRPCFLRSKTNVADVFFTLLSFALLGDALYASSLQETKSPDGSWYTPFKSWMGAVFSHTSFRVAVGIRVLRAAWVLRLLKDTGLSRMAISLRNVSRRLVYFGIFTGVVCCMYAVSMRIVLAGVAGPPSQEPVPWLDYSRFTETFLNVLVFATSEGWPRNLGDLLAMKPSQPVLLIAIISLLVSTVSIFTLNVLVGIIVENFDEEQEQLDYAGGVRSKLVRRWNEVQKAIFASHQTWEALGTPGGNSTKKGSRASTISSKDWLARFLQSKEIDIFFAVLCLLSAVSLQFTGAYAESYLRVYFPQYRVAIYWFNAAVILVYAVDVALQVAVLRRALFANAVFVFDAAVAVASLCTFFYSVKLYVEGSPFASQPIWPVAFRLVRVAYVLSKRLMVVRVISITLMNIYLPLLNVLGLIVLLIFWFALLGTSLFYDAELDPSLHVSFSSMQQSVLLLLSFCTGENFHLILAQTRSFFAKTDSTVIPVMAVLYTFTFVLIAFILLTNLFTGMVLKGFVDTKQNQFLWNVSEQFQQLIHKWRMRELSLDWLPVQAACQVLVQLDSPIGFRGAFLDSGLSRYDAVLAAVALHDIPVQNNCVHIRDVALNAVKRACMHHAESGDFLQNAATAVAREPEFMQSAVQLNPRLTAAWVARFPPDVKSEECPSYTLSEYLAASRIQACWRTSQMLVRGDRALSQRGYMSHLVFLLEHKAPVCVKRRRNSDDKRRSTLKRKRASSRKYSTGAALTRMGTFSRGKKQGGGPSRGQHLFSGRVHHRSSRGSDSSTKKKTSTQGLPPPEQHLHSSALDAASSSSSVTNAHPPQPQEQLEQLQQRQSWLSGRVPSSEERQLQPSAVAGGEERAAAAPDFVAIQISAPPSDGENAAQEPSSRQWQTRSTQGLAEDASLSSVSSGALSTGSGGGTKQQEQVLKDGGDLEAGALQIKAERNLSSPPFSPDAAAAAAARSPKRPSIRLPAQPLPPPVPAAGGRLTMLLPNALRHSRRAQQQQPYMARRQQEERPPSPTHPSRPRGQSVQFSNLARTETPQPSEATAAARRRVQSVQFSARQGAALSEALAAAARAAAIATAAAAQAQSDEEDDDEEEEENEKDTAAAAPSASGGTSPAHVVQFSPDPPPIDVMEEKSDEMQSQVLGPDEADGAK